MISSGRIEKLIKKEAVEIQKEYSKLKASVGGIKDMKGLPDAIFVVDVKYEKIAVLEAKKMGIPVIGIVDTNSDPDGIDTIIPANDDAIRSIRLITKVIADACARGIESSKGFAPKSDAPVIQKVKKDDSEVTIEDNQEEVADTSSADDESGKEVKADTESTEVDQELSDDTPPEDTNEEDK